jgi:glycerol-3-phosphate dehydrogenase (NAD(P)+)
MGLSGLGDLVLTCSSVQSRNFSYGRAIGESGAPPRVPHALVEGIATAAVVRDVARKRDIGMPISEAVAAVLDGSTSVVEAVENLMNRPLRAEIDRHPEAVRE